MFILLSITSIFNFMFIILLVATSTLDELPPYRTVLNCFHLLWTIVLIYFKLFSYILGWFYRLIIALTFKLFTFKLLTLFSLQYFCTSVSLKYFCTSPSPFHGYIYGGNSSKVEVATSRIMNIKLKILVIESRINTYSSSEYKISTVTG